MKSYKEYIITAEPFNVEILSSILWELNIDGINEEVNCLKVFAQDENVTTTSIQDELKHLQENKLLREFSVQENFIVEKTGMKNGKRAGKLSMFLIKLSSNLRLKYTKLK